MFRVHNHTQYNKQVQQQYQPCPEWKDWLRPAATGAELSLSESDMHNAEPCTQSVKWNEKMQSEKQIMSKGYRDGWMFAKKLHTLDYRTYYLVSSKKQKASSWHDTSSDISQNTRTLSCSSIWIPLLIRMFTMASWPAPAARINAFSPVCDGEKVQKCLKTMRIMREYIDLIKDHVDLCQQNVN